MNNEDKKRFARYRKNYDSTLEDNELINLRKNDKLTNNRRKNIFQLNGSFLDI